MIQPMGKSPKAAPYAAAAATSGTGMPYTTTAIAAATASPASAATCARTCQKASRPRSVATGRTATIVETPIVPSGA
jgi:hypothetical protein